MSHETSRPEARRAVRRADEFGRVAVMLGGRSSEREVSLDSGNAVLRALQSRGVNAHAWDPAEKSMAEFAAAGFARAWIALHGPGGEDGALQGALQWFDVPYTGSGVMASALAMDKIRSKHLFRATGLPTPDFRIVHDAADARQALEELGTPLILKPAGQGSSVGMTRVTAASEIDAAAQHALRFDEPALAESCIVGKEMTVAILQGAALPSIRIETPRVFYDYHAKYESEQTRYICPGTSSGVEEQRYLDLALAAFAAVGASGWGRVDFMAAADGEPQILEVNTVPGMTSHSLVPMAAKAAGIDFEELCWRVLETSFAVAARSPKNDAAEMANGA